MCGSVHIVDYFIGRYLISHNQYGPSFVLVELIHI